MFNASADPTATYVVVVHRGNGYVAIGPFTIAKAIQHQENEEPSGSIIRLYEAR